jgi:hypothetical protein
MISRRVLSSSLFALVLVVVAAGRSEAAPITVNFCPGDPTCPVGVTASLTFTAIANSDPNDYYFDLVISGTSAAPAFVDEVSFKIAGAQVQDYESLPTLVSAPGGGAPWVVFWDNISGSANSCVANTGQGNSVCAQSGPGTPSNFGAPLAGNTLTWRFVVDLQDTEGPVTAESLNLRAQFLNSKGKNVGILSPNGGTTSVPEPATLALLALGCALIPTARRFL